MSQHDFNIADQNGTSFLSDLNNVLAAIVSNNSGATEPRTTFPYQFWVDTSSGILKQRKADNRGWVNVIKFGQTALTTVDIGSSVQAYSAATPRVVVSQADAERGVSTAQTTWTAERVKQAINALSSGKVLQVVSRTISGHGIATITSADTQTNPIIDLGVIAKGDNSSFRIDVRWFGEGHAQRNMVAHIHRGSTRVSEKNNARYHGLSMATHTYPGRSDFDSTPEILTLTTLDKTGSTAGESIRYTLKFSSSSTQGVMWTNRCNGGVGSRFETGVSEIIVTEIGA